MGIFSGLKKIFGGTKISELDELIFFEEFDVGAQLTANALIPIIALSPAIVTLFLPFIIIMTLEQWTIYMVLSGAIGAMIWAGIYVKVIGEVGAHTFLKATTVLSGHITVEEQIRIEQLVKIDPRERIWNNILLQGDAFGTADELIASMQPIKETIGYQVSIPDTKAPIRDIQRTIATRSQELMDAEQKRILTPELGVVQPPAIPQQNIQTEPPQEGYVSPTSDIQKELEEAEIKEPLLFAPIEEEESKEHIEEKEVAENNNQEQAQEGEPEIQEDNLSTDVDALEKELFQPVEEDGDIKTEENQQERDKDKEGPPEDENVPEPDVNELKEILDKKKKKGLL